MQGIACLATVPALVMTSTQYCLNAVKIKIKEVLSRPVLTADGGH